MAGRVACCTPREPLQLVPDRGDLCPLCGVRHGGVRSHRDGVDQRANLTGDHLRLWPCEVRDLVRRPPLVQQVIGTSSGEIMAYGCTSLTLSQLAPLFVVSKSAAYRITRCRPGDPAPPCLEHTGTGEPALVASPGLQPGPDRESRVGHATRGRAETITRRSAGDAGCASPVATSRTPAGTPC